jgi:hypothetical protein
MDFKPGLSLQRRDREEGRVRGLAAVRRCYAEGGGDLCQVVVMGVT